MRLWHLVLLILVLGILLGIIRDPVGRIALIVFVTAVGEVILGTTAVLALFQTIGAIGMARGLFEHTAGRGGNHAGAFLRHGDHVDLAVHRGLAGAGCPALNGPATGETCAVAHRVDHSLENTGKVMTIANYAPEKFPHQWLPEKLELKTWEQIEPWYQKLLALPIESAEDLERWLVAAGELNSAVGQEGVERYVAMTCQTDDPDREAAYLAFVRDIEPKLKPLQNEVRNRYLDSPLRAQLSADRYAVFNRALENRRALYREENIPRETRLAELEQQYQKTMGAMTVTFEGKERTLAQMAPFLEETDRAVRQTAWELAASRRLEDRDALDDLFDQMLGSADRDRAGRGF